jgi:hypothetical protein
MKMENIVRNQMERFTVMVKVYTAAAKLKLFTQDPGKWTKCAERVIAPN